MSFFGKTGRARHLMAVIYGSLAFIAFGLWGEIASWNAYLERVSSQLAETAKAIGIHVDDVVEVARQPLVALGYEIGTDLESPAGNLAFISHMRKLAEDGRFIRSLAFVRADGRLVESTLSPLSPGLDLSYRDYFRFHSGSNSPELRIGSPAYGPVTRDWFITVSRRVNAADGTFAGVLLATIKVDHFTNFFKGYALGPGRTLLLIDNEGNVLLRLPQDTPNQVGSLAQTQFFREILALKPHGWREYVSRFDEKRRIGGYFRSQQTGVTTSVGAVKREIFAEWLGQAAPRWAFALLALGAAVFFGIRWQRQSWMHERSEAEIAAREAEFRAIANASSDLIEKVNEAGIRDYVSPSSRDLLELEPEQLVGRPIAYGYGPEGEADWAAALARLRQGASFERLSFGRRTSGGEIIWLESMITRAVETGGMVVVTRNITSQRRLQDKLSALANRDELTRAFNKRYFNVRLAEMAQAHLADGTPFALLLVDADRFKDFNDTYGHVPGDACLRRIAEAIQSVVRAQQDIVARFGGEEFAVLLTGFGPEGAGAIAEKVREAVFRLDIAHARNAPWGRITVSIGCAVFDGREIRDADGLQVAADRALYRAKHDARNCVRLHAFVPSEPQGAGEA